VAESNVNVMSRQRFGLLFSATLLVAGGAAAYFSIRAQVPDASRPDETIPTTTMTVGEVEIPPGPHREVFQANCVICHSAVLPLGQPVLTQKQWGDVVHKMADAYGAPINKDDEARIVEYMMVVQASR
jgi:hypothetical protein